MPKGEEEENWFNPKETKRGRRPEEMDGGEEGESRNNEQ